MTNQFVIKYHDLYYDSSGADDKQFRFNSDIDFANKYIHIDIARQVIIDRKLPSGCKVYQINFVEVEVK